MSIIYQPGGRNFQLGLLKTRRNEPIVPKEKKPTVLQGAITATKAGFNIGKNYQKNQLQMIKDKNILNNPNWTYQTVNRFGGREITSNPSIFRMKTDKGPVKGMFDKWHEKIELKPDFKAKNPDLVANNNLKLAQELHNTGMTTYDIEKITGQRLVRDRATGIEQWNHVGEDSTSAFKQSKIADNKTYMKGRGQVSMPTDAEMDIYLNPDKYTSKDLINLQKEQGIKLKTEGPKAHLSQKPVTSKTKPLLVQDTALKTPEVPKGFFGKEHGFGSKFGTGTGQIATALWPMRGVAQRPIMQVGKGLANIGKGGLKGLFGSGTVGAKATADAILAGQAAGQNVGNVVAQVAGKQAASTGLMAGMGPVGWGLMALSLLGMGKVFKPHTFLGKIFSDKRLKKNIKYVGKSKSGIPIVDFEYIDDLGIQGKYRGVLSKDVPYATEVHPKYGYDMVDYSKLDVEFKKIS